MVAELVHEHDAKAEALIARGFPGDEMSTAEWRRGVEAVANALSPDDRIAFLSQLADRLKEASLSARVGSERDIGLWQWSNWVRNLLESTDA